MQEGDILAAQEAYSAAKRGMLDLYTKRALVHALQSPEAFVGLDTALHTATSQYETMKAQVGEIKGAAAARRDELDALAVQVARSNAAVTAKRAELARLLAVYETAASQPLPPQSLVAGAVTITSPADAARVAEEMVRKEGEQKRERLSSSCIWGSDLLTAAASSPSLSCRPPLRRVCRPRRRRCGTTHRRWQLQGPSCGRPVKS